MVVCEQIDGLIESLSNLEMFQMKYLRDALDSLTLDDDLIGALLPETLPETGYQRALIHAGDDFEVVAAIWAVGGGTLIHDHGSEETYGVVRVIRGDLYNRIYRHQVDGNVVLAKSLTHEKGEFIEVPKGLVHAMGNRSETVALSLHVYSPSIVNVSYWDPSNLKPYIG